MIQMSLTKQNQNPALRMALEMSRPESWRGSGLTPEQFLPIAQEDAIPVAWVPPPEVLKALVAAQRSDRLSVVRSYEAAVLEQCRALLHRCRDPWIRDEAVLLGRAIDAFEAGHHEAAMTLAVALGEPLALWASEPRVQFFDSEAERVAWEVTLKKDKYSLAKLELSAVAPGQKLKRLEVLRHALIGPVPKFFTPYYPNQGQPVPNTVSRRATVHQPSIAHLSRDNALLAIMLSISILREQQSWSEEVRADEFADR
jgi:hypothetical protein